MSSEDKKPVVIAMDGSEHADYAFNYPICLIRVLAAAGNAYNAETIVATAKAVSKIKYLLDLWLYYIQGYMEHLHKPDHYVILLHVPERHAFMVGPLGGTADVESIQLMMREEEDKEKGFLERLAQKLKDGGIGGKVKSVAGKPGEVVCTVAEEEHALFIICGSRGKGTFRRTFLGSISDYVLHHSHIPVFICKHKDLHSEHVHSPSLKEKIMNSPLFRRKNKDSPKNSPKVGRKKTDSETE